MEHKLFFAASPKLNYSAALGNTDGIISVVVDGVQIVKAKTLLRMRLTEAATINNRLMPKNTLVFGFISFQPNRALINIENIDHHPTNLKAFDLQDGSEGIYVEITSVPRQQTKSWMISLTISTSHLFRKSKELQKYLSATIEA